MLVSAKNYPVVHHAFDLIRQDNRATSEQHYAVPDAFINQLPVVEGQLAVLTLDELDTLCSGEDSDQAALVAAKSCSEAWNFLCLFFDGWIRD